MKLSFARVFFLIFLLAAVTLTVIAFGRGYRLDIKKRAFQPTGLLVATSSPDGAEIFINGDLTSATNTTLNLPPDDYEVKIAKEGFIPWEKKLKIQGEVVTKVDALLFPTAPSLRAITSTGTMNPLLSPDGTKLVFGVSESNQTSSKKGGVWALDLTSRSLRLDFTTKQIAKDEDAPFSEAKFFWSPDSKQVLAETKNAKFYLLDADKLNSPPQNVTATISLIKERFEQEFRAQEERRLQALKSDLELYNFATSSAKILSFSPDETKFLYQAKKSLTLSIIIEPRLIGTNPTQETRDLEEGKVYIYDIKEDKNYEIQGIDAPTLEEKEEVKEEKDLSSLLKNTFPLQWYSSSRHLILTEAKKLSILEYDGTNKATVYASSFEDNFVTPWPDGSKLIILTTLNPEVSQQPNLYTINLK